MLKCTDGEYYDMTDKKCNPGTGVNCKTFGNSPTDCTSCNGNFILENSKCEKQVCIKDSYWRDQNTKSSQCTAARTTCFGIATNCTSCAPLEKSNSIQLRVSVEPSPATQTATPLQVASDLEQTTVETIHPEAPT